MKIVSIFIAFACFCKCFALQKNVYVLEGQDATLECRIPRPVSSNTAFYWLGPKDGNIRYDNYAFGNRTFDSDYRIIYAEDRYDLLITKATYDRNNGQYTCRLIDESIGLEVTSFTNLTVLIKPGSPLINPLNPTATQGESITLTCSSKGGSPDPDIVWYRLKDHRTMQSIWKPGGGRDNPTTATLILHPDREDDGAELMCEVRSKALASNEKMAAAVTLNVNYYPIVRIAPSNPVRVIEGNNVELTCRVDAKPVVNNVNWKRRNLIIERNPVLRIDNAAPEDAGRYICEADNNLGRTGEAEVTLEVLFPPSVTVEAHKVVNKNEDVEVACIVYANPKPDIIYWTKIGDPKFKQNRETLQLRMIKPADHGQYVCHAVSTLSPTDQGEIIIEGNATMKLSVRHAPGITYILPLDPVAVDRGSMTLTCGANPPGYPDPRYRWWIDGKMIEIQENYTISIASETHEGHYYCQPFNTMGNGTKIMVNLRVYKPPRILEELKPTAKYRRERTDLRLSCRAQGKPKPSARWLKDTKEIKQSDGFYSIDVEYTQQSGDQGYIVQSTLIFEGPLRIGMKTLRPEDRGRYECVFDNEAQSVSSEQLVRIQHPPATAHRQNKVAADSNESVRLNCKMRSFPSPTFQWSHRNQLMESGIYGVNHEVKDTDLGEDTYSSVLTIHSISETDYGPYTCKATNEEGPSSTVIYLQRKGRPDPPFNLKVMDSGKDFIEVKFDRGFDGGFPDTNVSAVVSAPGEQWRVFCPSKNTCLLEGLRQNAEHVIRLSAGNPLGNSDPTPPVSAWTAVDPDSIPSPDEVFVELSSGMVVFGAPASDLSLVGRIEIKYAEDQEWTKVPAEVQLDRSRGQYHFSSYKHDINVRVQLCISGNLDLCGRYQEAMQVNEIPHRLLAAEAMQSVVSIIIGIVVAIAIIALLVIFLFCCCCKTSRKTKLKNKNADLDVTHRGVVTQQAPPPPYYTVGMDNKAMNGSIEKGIEGDHSKTAVYGSQPYQQYNHHPGHQNTNGIGGFMDNSYSNSNNGGSVNSQDSLWHVKATGDGSQMKHHPTDPNVDPRTPYGQYNPVVHGGYGIGGYDDYAQYPQMHYQQGLHEEYPTHPGYSMAPNGDPYGVLGPRTIEEHYDQNLIQDQDQHDGQSRHHSVMAESDSKPPHISFDESLESGFSTPNSRNRRVIREIIV